MIEWKEVTLDSVANINPSETLKKGEMAKKIPMEALSPYTKKPASYSVEKYNGGMKFKNGDTIVARITPCLENGKTAYIYFLNQYEVDFGSTEYIILREKEGISDKQFLYYFAISSVFRDVAILSMTGSSGRQRVQTDVVRQHLFELPPLPEQKAIADVLSSLDDKIDLLHRQNLTLEAMAETLFRQWFIEEAQEDWGEAILDDIISVKGGTTPSTKEPEYWDGNIYWTSPRDLSNHNSVFLFDTERKITTKGFARIGSGLMPVGTVLLSSRAPIGYLAITDIPVAINQGYIAIVCDKLVSNYFMYLWCKSNMEDIKNAGNGSTFEEISKSNFKALALPMPSKQRLEEFDEVISPAFRKIRSNQTQIRTLEKLRDTLLPKLMSGEVRVDRG
jgi:type I restriction enzyme S subunit